jgi:hypothetical protein
MSKKSALDSRKCPNERLSVKCVSGRGLMSSGALALMVAGILVSIAPHAEALKGRGQGQATALKAKEILDKNCSKCHNAGFIFDPKSHASLIQDVVKSGDPANSKLIQKISSGAMPPDPNPRVTPQDLQTLKEWIQLGAPDWNAPTPAQAKVAVNLTEEQILKDILEDLQSLPEDKRPYVRYFSSANLLRNPDSAEDMKKAETALGKLVNSLSWSPDIVKLQPFGTGKALYRLDIRDVDWTSKIWDEVLSSYPYGFAPAHERGRVDQIRSLSGAAVPYIRVDWFTATASVPPLYHDILHLPDHITGKGGLEEMLGVDAAKDQEENKVVRGGLENSGVSHNNRAVERHLSQYGYYYKSFDFRSNEGRKNIFQFPLDFKEDGGEFIFSLPNGMQAYLVANSKGAGERLSIAPSDIVRDRLATFDEVYVTNGLSCISCHAAGMKYFVDEVRQDLDTRQHPNFDLERAKLWYLKTQDLQRIQVLDAEKFKDAVVKAGGAIPETNGQPDLDPNNEPVTIVAKLYKLAPVSAAAAAAECGLPLDEFKNRLGRSSKIAELGLGLLLNPHGSIKRDIWEQDFGKVVEELGIGDYIVPNEHQARSEEIDPRIPIRIVARGGSSLANRLKSQIFYKLSKSDEVKPVEEGGNKLVTVSAAQDGSHVTLKVEVDGQTLGSDGDLEDFTDLASKLADEVHLSLAHRVVPSSPVSITAHVAAQLGSITDLGLSAPSGTEQLLALALRTGSIGAAVSVDRGPNSTYKMGDEIVVRFSVPQDCFAALYDIDSSGEAKLLFPNLQSTDNHLQAGRVYTGDTWGLTANGTPGRERMFLLAAPSNDQLPGVNAFVQNPSGESSVSKSVGVFARKVQASTQSAAPGSIGASLVEFFTSK